MAIKKKGDTAISPADTSRQLVSKSAYAIWAPPTDRQIEDSELDYELQGCSMLSQPDVSFEGQAWAAVDLCRLAQEVAGQKDHPPPRTISDALTLVQSLDNKTWKYRVLGPLGLGRKSTYNNCLLVQLPLVAWFNLVEERLFGLQYLDAQGKAVIVQNGEQGNFTSQDIITILVNFLRSSINSGVILNQLSDLLRQKVLPPQMRVANVDWLIDPNSRKPTTYQDFVQYWQKMSGDLVEGWSLRLELTQSGRLHLLLCPLINQLAFLHADALETLLAQGFGDKVNSKSGKARADREMLSQLIARNVRFTSRNLRAGDQARLIFLDDPKDFISQLPVLRVSQINWPASTSLIGDLYDERNQRRVAPGLNLEYLTSRGKWIVREGQKTRDVILLPEYGSLLGQISASQFAQAEAPRAKSVRPVSLKKAATIVQEPEQPVAQPGFFARWFGRGG